MFAIAALMAMSSLAVDFGRVQLARTELMRLADASARAAAAKLASGRDPARQAAKDVAALNPVDETPFTLTNADITFGIWDAQTKTFSALPNSNITGANAVRVTATRSAAKGNALPLHFGPAIGMNQVDVSVSSIARAGGIENSATATVTGRANVWFAGLPSTASAAMGGDVTYASNCPAVQFTGFSVTSGASLQFAATGILSNTGSGGNNPEGDTGSIQTNETNNMGGKSNIKAPLNSLIGVFLSDSEPTHSPAPSQLDFSTSTARNYTTLSPQLKQTFYIGNGQANGQPQTIVVPAGATRLYFGSMDPYGWHNNSGTATVTVTSVGGTIRVVK